MHLDFDRSSRFASSDEPHCQRPNRGGHRLSTRDRRLSRRGEMATLMKCCVCNSTRIMRLGSVGTKPGAVTSDSALIQHSVIVWRCTDCGHLQKLHTEEDWRVIGEIYNDYAGHRLSGGREQL